MYEHEELDKLFKACNEAERLWYEFFLMTGMREQEVMYLYWSDVNFAASTVRVSPQTRPWMDTQGVQRARDSDSYETGEETEGVEGEGRQDMRFGVSDRRVQSET